MRKLLLAACFIVTAFLCARADIIAQWNFDSVPPDGSPTTGTTAPSVGSGTASLIGGVTGGFSAGSTNDPASSTDDSGWQTSDYPAKEIGNKTGGVQFTVSTVGYSNIVVRWDQRVTSAASKYYRLQYSTNGTTFSDYGPPITMQAAPSIQSYYEAQTNNLSSVAGV